MHMCSIPIQFRTGKIHGNIPQSVPGFFHLKQCKLMLFRTFCPCCSPHLQIQQPALFRVRNGSISFIPNQQAGRLINNFQHTFLCQYNFLMSTLHFKIQLVWSLKMIGLERNADRLNIFPIYPPRLFLHCRHYNRCFTVQYWESPFNPVEQSVASALQNGH